MRFVVWPSGHMEQNQLQIVEIVPLIQMNLIGELIQAFHLHCQGDGIAGSSPMECLLEILYMVLHYPQIVKEAEAG